MLVGEHGVEVRAARCQHQPVSSEFFLLHAKGHVAQVAAFSELLHLVQEGGRVAGGRECIAGARWLTGGLVCT